MPATRRLRLMTYNVHRCIGIDRRHAPERIARVIEETGADVVALQELEVGHPKRDRFHQPFFLARALGMDLHYQPSRDERGTRFGNAILSRLPMRSVRAGLLPTMPGLRISRRGALWVTVSLGGAEVQVINTHLGLLRAERFRQFESLLGRDWLVHPECTGPRIVCGDFNGVNEAPASLLGTMRDVQRGRSKATWPSLLPLRRLDHVYACPSLEVAKVEILRTKLTRVASDHLPVVVDFINRHAG